MLAWIGIALLAVSWLFALPWYHQPAWALWVPLLSLGTLLLMAAPCRLPGRRLAAVAGLLMLPAALLVPLPWRVGFALAAVGLGLQALGLARVLPGDLPKRLCRRLALGTAVAGLILQAQGLTLFLYGAATARSHNLPAFLARVLGWVAHWLDIGAGVSGSTVTIFSMREHHAVGATWELLADPASMLFIVGAIVLAAGSVASGHAGVSVRQTVLRVLAFVALAVLWLPLRAGLIMSVLLTSVLRTEYEELPNSIHWLWSTWLHLALLAIPVLVAWRLLMPPAVPRLAAAAAVDARPAPAPWRLPVGVLLLLAGALALTAAVAWDPVGTRQRGRVIIEEYHPDPEKVWERADKPFDTEWYGHLSGYNYYCIAQYLDRFYQVSRLVQPLNDDALRDGDVLVLKTPTRPPYSEDEQASIERFVNRGGGLLLIGEHTDVFGTSYRLNPVARRFGFHFHNDCLFGMDSVFEQRYRPPWIPHPVVHYIDWMNFATSCSLQVGGSPGRGVIRSTGLKSKTADYHVDNFYPVPSDSARMRYGAFVQLWATQSGKGRVLAFTDSTIFSNFSTFEPGKSELMLGMIEWLNRQAPPTSPRPWLWLAGIGLVLGGVWLARRRQDAWILLAGAAAAGFTGGALAINHTTRAAMPLPACRPDRSLVRVVMDRTVSATALSNNGFILGREDGFGIFERWILRLGYFIARRTDPECFAPDTHLLVVSYPSKPVSADYRQRLDAYVRAGGRLLVLDATENRQSTANDLLETFGVRVDPAASLGGTLATSLQWQAFPVQGAREVTGGQPFAWIETPSGRRPVGTWQRCGKGTVTVIGFGDRFCDQRMGVTGDVEPNADLRKVFDAQYDLIRALVTDRPLVGPDAAAPVTPAAAP
jgi:hypothetical protein